VIANELAEILRAEGREVEVRYRELAAEGGPGPSR